MKDSVDVFRDALHRVWLQLPWEVCSTRPKELYEGPIDVAADIVSCRRQWSVIGSWFWHWRYACCYDVSVSCVNR